MMIKSIGVILPIFAVLLMYSCTEKLSTDAEKKNREPSGEQIIGIKFSFPGDDIGSPENRAVLHQITASIKSRGAGEILRSGFGMGNMELVVKLKGEESINGIKEIINEIYPAANYSIKKYRGDMDVFGISRPAK